MSGKRWFTAVCAAIATTALAAGPARADEIPELDLTAPVYASVAPLGASQDVPYYVANRSDVPVQLEGIDLHTGPAATGVFTLNGPSTCPEVGQQLLPQEACMFTLRFTPRAVTPVFATLQVRTTKLVPGVKQGPALDSPVVNVRGSGFTVSLPGAQDFGRQPVGLLGGPTAVTLTSTGGVGVKSATVSGPDGGDFLLVANGCDVDLDAPCDIRVRFAPSALGQRTATLTVQTTSAYFFDVPLSGYGVPLAPGQKGDKGDPGQPGTTGPEGPRGPAGLLTCRNTAAARLLCDALFAPGTWKPAGTVTAARFTLSRGGRVYARGRATVNRHGRVRMRLSHPRKLRKGTYVLKVRVGHGRHALVLRRITRIR
jgi:hypothetical protein